MFGTRQTTANKNHKPKTPKLTTTDRILCRLLALRDAAFLPVRIFVGSSLNANTWSMRQRFHAGGIPWSSEEGSDRGRKAAQRALEEAEAAGMVLPLPTAGRTPGFHLTESGEHRAASLCSQYVLADGIAVIIALERRAVAGVIDVPEDDLIPSLPAW